MRPLNGRFIFPYCAWLVTIGAMLLSARSGSAQPSAPASLPDVQYHLTARPWQALNTPRDAYLDRVEGVVRFEATLLNGSGAIIDPVKGVEWQYSTPYFANAVGFLMTQGRATDLLSKGVAAMNHATSQMAIGNSAIPQQHGNFFIAPMAEALGFYAPFVSASQIATWSNRMKLPIAQLTDPTQLHNWRAYAMKGEWYRAQHGLVTPATAQSYIEDNWANTQRYRFVGNPWNLYHDFSTDPDAFPYDAATRANLWNMLVHGYNGASAGEIKTLIERGTQSALLMQDASGQCAASGRTGDHTWNDAYAGLGFGMMAENAWSENNFRLAGQFRHASLLAFNSVERWRNNQAGKQYYFVTKNHFPYSQQVAYAQYGALTNYNGNMMYHLAESWRAWQSEIPEAPAPVEIGGYALVPDSTFADAFANAGGMQLEAALRGSTELVYGRYWTALGITRFSRVNWDSRLGPSDGMRSTSSGSGISYAPTFLEAGAWKTLASLPGRYEGALSIISTHPLLVRARIDYTPKAGQAGPTFTDNLIVTPDGVLSTVTSSAAPGSFGVTWPVLTNDGASLTNTYSPTPSPRIASIRYPNGTDEQNYISLHPAASTPPLNTTLSTIRSAYGDLRPVRMVSGVASTQTFIYPRSAGDPSAESVRTSFVQNGQDFSSVLGSVKGSLYVGRTSAGGVGAAIDLNNDGINDVTFSTACGFILQLENGVVSGIEADRAVDAVVQGTPLHLEAFTPILDPIVRVPVTGVSVTPASISVTVGQTSPLTATVSPANASNQMVSWSSSNPTAAAVNASGLVTGLAAGNATITATTTDGGFTADSVVTVQAGQTVSVTGVTVSPATASVNVGATLPLGATVSPTNATNKSVVWSSSNSAAATVNSSGVVTGVAAGSATITATTVDGGFSGQSVITVTAAVVITSANGFVSIPAPPDKTGTFTVTFDAAPSISPMNTVVGLANGSQTAYTGIAVGLRFNPTGMIDARNGGAFAAASSIPYAAGVSYHFRLTVDVTSHTYSAFVTPAGGSEVTIGSNYAFRTEQNTVTKLNTWVADVSATPGGALTLSVGTNPPVPVTGVTVAPATVSIGIGATTQMTATIAPANASNQAVTWSSSNPAIASVNNSGVVTGVAAGSANVIATTADGGFAGQGTVTVQPAAIVLVTGVTVSPATASIAVGATTPLTATMSPSNATNKTVTWSSSNPAVATVNSAGLVAGVAAGGAMITATTVDGSFTSQAGITVSAVPTTIAIRAFDPAASGPFGAFAPDTPYVAGGTIATRANAIDVSAVVNPAPVAIYQTERWGATTYTVSGLNALAVYTVRLHFAETYFTAVGKRKFNVQINGAQVLTDFDIFAAAGATNKAVVREFSATADAAGAIMIKFINGSVNNAKMDGIEVLSAVP